MIESKDYLILSQLKKDFEEKFTDGIRTDLLQVKIGEYLWEDMKMKPSISLKGDVITIDTEHKIMGGAYYKTLDITLDIFMDCVPELDNHEDIYILKDEIEKFLKSDSNTFRSGFQMGDQSLVYIGGPDDPVKQAQITFSIIYRD